MNVAAYELLFRNGATAGQANVVDGTQATCQVLANAIVEMGLENVCGNRPAYVNFTQDFFDSNMPLPVHPDQVVIEILETETVNDRLLTALKQWKDRGFKIALDDFTLTPETRPLMDLANIVKLDVRATPTLKQKVWIKEIRRSWKVTLLAEKIETAEEFASCVDMGYDLFQGYFLSRPRILESNRIPKNRLAILQLLAQLQDPNIDFKDLETLVCQDLSLTTRLLQSVNSSSMGLARRVDSVHRAIAMLGIGRIRNLASLSLLAALDDAPPPLMSMALVRAKMCERLGAGLNSNPDSYFTVGLLSALDLFLQRPLAEIIATIPLTEDLVGGLLHGEGGMGAALKCTLAYEKGEFEGAGCLHLSQATVWQAYIDALKLVEGPGGMLHPEAPAQTAQPAAPAAPAAPVAKAAAKTPAAAPSGRAPARVG